MIIIKQYTPHLQGDQLNKIEMNKTTSLEENKNKEMMSWKPVYRVVVLLFV